MKTIYASSDLQEALKFEISDEILKRNKEIQDKIKTIELEEGETVIVYSNVLNDLLAGDLYTDNCQIAVLKDKILLRYHGWHGKIYIEGCDLLTMPDLFFEEKFISLRYFNYRNSIEFDKFVAEEDKEKFKELLDKYDTEKNREIRNKLNEES